MKAGLLMCAVLCLPLVGTRERLKTRPIPDALDSELHHIRENATQLFQVSNYAEAAKCYRAGLGKAERAGARSHAGRFLIGLANCAFISFEYRDAIQFYLRAADIARSLHDVTLASVAAENLSSLYLRMGDLDSASAALEQSLAMSGEKNRRATLLLNAAILYGIRKESAQAIRLFEEGIRRAKSADDRVSEVKGLNSLGWLLLQDGQLHYAARVLEHGFTLRRNFRTKEIAAVYRNLGLLRVAQGNTPEGIRLLKKAVISAEENPAGALLWNIHYYLARTLDAAGYRAEALESYRRALDFARAWRIGIIPADSTQLGADIALQKVYDDYIAALMRQFKKHPGTRLAWTMLAAAEENRARAYSERLFDAKAVPPEYWRKLNDYRKTEIALLTHDSPANRAAAANARLRLTELEAQLGLLASTGVPTAHSVLVRSEEKKSHRKNENTSSDNPLFHLRSNLRPDEALLSFHTGQNESYLWAVTDNHIEIHTLPAKSALSARAREFRESIRAGKSAAHAESEQLYTQIFGSLSRRVSTKTRWIVVLDDGLFELPLAALKSDGRYLPEIRSIRLLPFAGMLQTRAKAFSQDTFLGVADPIYNIADARWQGTQARQRWWVRLLRPPAALAVGNSAQMPRLVASRGEVETCARAWGASRKSSILMGADTNRLSIERALESGTAIAHFAAHVVQRPDNAEQTWIAIGLNPDGDMDFLTPAEISARKFQIGLVTLSGCSSGSGKALPGIGLLGLTRAWLMAGSQIVAATHWPTPDESGTLLRVFYEHLSQAGLSAAGAAEALRSAQIKMIQSQTWRSEPRYWAAFFVAGKD